MKQKNEKRRKLNLETERLMLRNVLPEEAQDYYALVSDIEAMPMLDPYWESRGKLDFLDCCETIKYFSQYERARLVIKLKGEKRVMGNFSVLLCGPRSNPAINALSLSKLHIGASYRRQGYGQEFLEALVSYVFQETSHNLITASVLEINEPALALLEKVGFVREGILHKAGYYPGLGAVDQVSLYLEKS